MEFGAPHVKFWIFALSFTRHPAIHHRNTFMAKKSQYKFCFGPWNISEGQDPYGPTTRPAQTFDWKLAKLKRLGICVEPSARLPGPPEIEPSR